MEKSDSSSNFGSRFQRSLTSVSRLLFSLLVVIAIIVILGYTLGWKVEIVLSGSMEPSINVGGVIATHPISPEDIRVGDIITYTSTSGPSVICHRVVLIEETPSLRFFTRGDANNHSDPDPVLPSQVTGIVCFHTPYLGYILYFVRLPLIFLGILITFVFFVTISVRSSGHNYQK